MATTVKARPQRRDEIVGAVARYRTVRGAHRWLAAIGYDPAVENQDGFRSAGAAAAWLADRLARGVSPAVPWEWSGVDR